MVKVSPYLALILLQYLPMFLTGVATLPGFIGFFVEFLWIIIPLIAFAIFVSWYLYRYTGRIWVGAILNTLFFAWISAGLFPFGKLG